MQTEQFTPESIDDLMFFVDDTTQDLEENKVDGDALRGYCAWLDRQEFPENYCTTKIETDGEVHGFASTLVGEITPCYEPRVEEVSVRKVDEEYQRSEAKRMLDHILERKVGPNDDYELFGRINFMPTVKVTRSRYSQDDIIQVPEGFKYVPEPSVIPALVRPKKSLWERAKGYVAQKVDEVRDVMAPKPAYGLAGYFRR